MWIDGVTSLEDLTTEDRLDSRELDEKIVALEAEQEEEMEADDNGAAIAAWEAAGNGELLDALRKLRAETEDEGWRWGILFIRASGFTDYARELAEDCGMVPDNLSWPLNHIDWEAAADDLLNDYSAVTIGGSTYYYREA